MDLSIPPFAAPTSVPRHVPDQRPTADAAVSSRQRVPPLPVATPVLTGTPHSQTAEVSRSMLLATVISATGEVSHAPDSQNPERRLKPFDLPMLPDEAAEDTGSRRPETDPLRGNAADPEHPPGSADPDAPT